MADRLAWKALGNCVDVNPALMYPDRGAHPEDVRNAKELCRGCVVREECLDFALTRPEKYGVWGGTTEPERRVLRRERRLAVAS